MAACHIEAQWVHAAGHNPKPCVLPAVLQALERAQAAVAAAVFVLAPDLSPDPAADDLRAIMLTLRLGHAVQRRHLQMSPQARRPVAAQLAAAAQCVLHKLQPVRAALRCGGSGGGVWRAQDGGGGLR